MSRKVTYTPKGACCTKIEIELDGETLVNAAFTNGCRGNHQAIESLIKGQNAREVITRLKGIKCRDTTSCPDQLAQALEQALTETK